MFKRKPAPEGSILSLQDPELILCVEIWLSIFTFFTAEELALLFSVAKGFARIAIDGVLWRKLCGKIGINCHDVVDQACARGVSVQQKSYVNEDWWQSLLNCSRSTDAVNLVSRSGKRMKYESVQRTAADSNDIKISTWDPWFPSLRDSVNVSQKTLSWFRVYATQCFLRRQMLQQDYSFNKVKSAHIHGVTCSELVYLKTDSGVIAKDNNLFLITGSWDCRVKIWKFNRIRSKTKLPYAGSVYMRHLWHDKPAESLNSSNSIANAIEDDESETDIEDSVWESGNEDDSISMAELATRAAGASLGPPTGRPFLSSTEKISHKEKARWKNAGLANLDLVSSIITPGKVECLGSFNDILVTGGAGNLRLNIWSISKAKHVRTLSHASLSTVMPVNSAVSCIAVNEILVVSCTKSVICVWHLASGNLLSSIVQPGSNFSSLKLASVDPELGINTHLRWVIIATCGMGSIGVWGIPSVENIVNASRTTSSFEFLNLLSKVHPTQILDPAVASCINAVFQGTTITPPGILCAQIQEIRLSHQGGNLKLCLVCGFKDGNMRSWTISMHLQHHPGELAKIEAHQMATFSSLGDWITCICPAEALYSFRTQSTAIEGLGFEEHKFGIPRIADIMIAGSWDGRVRLWDRRRGGLRRTVTSNSSSAVLSLVMCSAIDAGIGSNSQLIVAGGYDGGLIIYEFGFQP